ncbi:MULTISPECIES: hypothetical protein [Mycolicibacterium]|uniref:Uncharacterized protein n=1 Tax=Mycolicibacterium chlorophenolicum TaxID=37916 RepID=A0A0J6Z5J3_9MYCO|nr:hypothetical protein [Mycolicibacterium chlorophenolicum]KMO79886.1 hypothetical protein MCHLDSM_01770 [Mycolicibacterium chlorophenolicum]
MAWLLRDDDEDDRKECDPKDLWDNEIPHGGVWARLANTTDTVRCLEHGLRPDQH